MGDCPPQTTRSAYVQHILPFSILNLHAILNVKALCYNVETMFFYLLFNGYFKLFLLKEILWKMTSLRKRGKPSDDIDDLASTYEKKENAEYLKKDEVLFDARSKWRHLVQEAVLGNTFC